MPVLFTALASSSLTEPGVRLAAAGGLEGKTQAYAAALTGSAPSQQPAAPAVPASKVLATAGTRTAGSDPLTVVAQVAETFGADESLSGGLCTKLGATRNNQKLPVKQFEVLTDRAADRGKNINVWRVPGSPKRQIILADFHGKENWVYLYRTNEAGELLAALYAGPGGEPTIIYTREEALDRFNAQVAWWVARERELRERTRSGN